MRIEKEDGWEIMLYSLILGYNIPGLGIGGIILWGLGGCSVEGLDCI